MNKKENRARARQDQSAKSNNHSHKRWLSCNKCSQLPLELQVTDPSLIDIVRKQNAVFLSGLKGG
jgi:hypothetical protein